MNTNGWSTAELLALTECDEGTLHKSKTPDRARRFNALVRPSWALVYGVEVPCAR